MPKFRKKPVVIEAEQFKEARQPWPAGVILHQPNAVLYDRCGGEQRFPQDPYPAVQTLEGVMRVCEGDWIITGVNGEKYPCKPDIFAKTYEAVE